jgi:hypothetical protein
MSTTGIGPGRRPSRAHGVGEFGVRDQELGPAVLEDERDGPGVEAVVEGVQDGPGHRHAVVSLEHGGDVGRHDGDRVADPDVASRQRRGEPPRPSIELSIRVRALAVDDRGLVRVNRRGSMEEAGRRQGSVIGRAPPEPVLHGASSRRIVTRPVRRPAGHTTRIAPSRSAGNMARFGIAEAPSAGMVAL